MFLGIHRTTASKEIHVEILFLPDLVAYAVLGRDIGFTKHVVDSYQCVLANALGQMLLQHVFDKHTCFSYFLLI